MSRGAEAVARRVAMVSSGIYKHIFSSSVVECVPGVCLCQAVWGRHTRSIIGQTESQDTSNWMHPTIIITGGDGRSS